VDAEVGKGEDKDEAGEGKREDKGARGNRKRLGKGQVYSTSVLYRG